MSTKILSSSLILLVSFVIFVPSLSYADGFIVIDPMPPIRPPEPRPQPARLNIKYHKVDVNIENQVATTKVDQLFQNPYNRDLEGTYIFPVPDGATISDFKMYVDGEALDGRILGKEEARKIYEGIVRKQQDPALLEYIGREMFQARVYPIPAKGEKRIKLEYSEVLRQDSGTVKYHYTLDTERFSAKALQEVSIKVDITSPQAILNVYSPTHEIEIDNQSEKQVQAEYNDENVRPDRDFLLYYTISPDEVGFNVLTYKDGNEDGFFLAMMSPNIGKIKQRVVAKNILFVLDTSGSMAGEKIEQARSALAFCLNSLNPKDQFNIISFNTSIDSYRNKLVDASRSNVKEAIGYSDNLEANGGTNINEALTEAMSLLKSGNRPNMIIFLTDGLPTVGVQDISEIISNVSKANKADGRLFVFGVGYDVNTQLLDKISLENNGVPDYVEPDENIEVKISNFYAKVANPILTDLKLIFSGVKEKEIYPSKLPDLFKGSQLIVVGRYQGNGQTTIKLNGKQDAKNKTYQFITDFVRQGTENDYLPRIWASRKIAYLVDEIVLNGESEELVDEIVRLSKKYGIITEYTSFLVDLDSPEFSEAEDDGFEMMRDRAYQSLDLAKEEQSGSGAVGRAKAQQSMRGKMSAAAPSYELKKQIGEEKAERAQQVIRKVRARTFYQQNNIWVDADHNSSTEVIQIKPFSQAYFELIDKLPDLNPYLAVGEQVIVNVGTYSVQIDEEGDEELSADVWKKLMSARN